MMVATRFQLKVRSRSNLAGLNDDSGGKTRKKRRYLVLSESAGEALEYDNCNRKRRTVLYR